MQAIMWKYVLGLLFLSTYFVVSHQETLIDIVQLREPNVTSVRTYMVWPNATVPFYINPEHFDHEQSLAILTALSRFAFATCLKFAPVMAAPAANEHVLVFDNERGVRRCVFDTRPHSVFEPHPIVLGYKCLQSPHIDAAMMRALGFPFEHNHVDRDFYIDVLLENVEPERISSTLTVEQGRRLDNSRIYVAGKKMGGVQDFKLYDNIFVETNLQSNDYDSVILIIYPEEFKVPLPSHIGSFIENIATLDKHIHKVATVWNCDYVSGGKLILSPTGSISPYHDAKVVKDAAYKGMTRALDSGAKKPLLVVQNVIPFPDGQLVSILGAFEALYIPLQLRERANPKNFIKIGLFAEEKRSEDFEKVVRNAIALERARSFTRDIAGGDPERMAPARIVDYVIESFQGDSNIKVTVIDDEKVIEDDYPLLAAVSRASTHVDRHKPRVVEIEYKPSNAARITETLLLVGKGVTYDTGGADIKISGKMAGMSRDKCGAAAVAGFLKACSIMKPPHLKVIGVMCLCRNSIGSNSYVADELLLSKSGKTVRVANTDAEGRLAMADALFKASELAAKELNPHIYTIATLTGHARACYGGFTAAMDNHSAKATNHASRLQFSASRMSEGIEVSTIRPEDLAVNNGKARGDDLVQLDMDAKCRNHQLAAGFLIKVGGLEDKNVKYTHLDIAGAAGMPPAEPTAEPVLSLCHLHKVLL